MKTVKVIAAAFAVAALAASCSVTRPVAATGNPVGSKVGIAKTTRVLMWHFDGGDASIQTAAKNGGITRISTVDVKSSTGLFTSSIQTIVTGE